MGVVRGGGLKQRKRDTKEEDKERNPKKSHKCGTTWVFCELLRVLRLQELRWHSMKELNKGETTVCNSGSGLSPLIVERHKRDFEDINGNPLLQVYSCFFF